MAAFDLEQAGELGEQGVVEGLAGVGDVVGELDVDLRTHCGQQIEALEDEADVGAAGLGALGVGEAGEVFALYLQRTYGWRSEAAEQVEEGGFAGA
jgi:hypothetical protein